jgi:hypothetical protein
MPVPARVCPFSGRKTAPEKIYFIPYLRLVARLFVLPRDAAQSHIPANLPDGWLPEAIVDTGAPLTLFPFSVWRHFQDVIRWLNQPPAPVPQRVAILGSRFAYRLGRVRIGAFDRDANWLPAVWTNALFLDDDPSAPKRVVLGLKTRLFDQRQIRCANAPEELLGQVWWLEDSTPAVSQ